MEIVTPNIIATTTNNNSESKALLFFIPAKHTKNQIIIPINTRLGIKDGTKKLDTAIQGIRQKYIIVAHSSFDCGKLTLNIPSPYIPFLQDYNNDVSLLRHQISP